MKSILLFALAVLLTRDSRAEWGYPPTKAVDASDNYFGKTFKDPYRWLENLKDNEVADWFKAQAELTDRLLDKIPARDALA
jgi:prolyl oligopeptidase